MNPHPTDVIPAFVLGALESGQMLAIGEHVAGCDACRTEADRLRAALEGLPYDAPLPLPPPHVKRQLLARIAASRQLARPRWPLALAACSLALALAFGIMLAQARGQLAETQQAADFMSAPQTVARRLNSPDRRASAVMYMQPDNRHAVLVVSGMPQAAPGKRYQFWLSKPGVQVPANTFDVGQNGAAMLAIDAPAPVNEYQQVMVTVESSGGSIHPSDQIVLSGDLAYGSRPSARTLPEVRAI